MTSFNLGRRGFLKTLGAGAALAALPLGARSRAVAAPPAIPKRIIFFYGSGMLYDVWKPSGTETDWKLGEVHAPLVPHQKDLIVIDGLGMVSEEIDPGPKGNAHNQGAKHALAAANTTQTDKPGGASIDQFIAQKLKESGVLTMFPSLEFQCAGWTNELQVYSGAVASAANTMLPGMWDPRSAWDRVFKSFAGGDSSAAEAYKARQTAVMGLAKDEFNRLRTRVSTEDRVKLDAHLSLLTDLEARFGSVARTCTKPARTSIEADFTDKCDLGCYDPSNPKVFARNFDITTKWNSKLLAAAMACDLTRVGFLEVQTAPDGLVGYSSGDYGSTDLHDLVHKVNDRKNPLNKDPLASGVIKKACSTEAQKLADLITELKSIPEADGGTLFDHTVILWCSQIGYGSHDLAELPWVIAGSAGGYFKTGRYIQLPSNPKSSRGQPHNDLFVSLANAMDIPVTKFGNPDCCNGPIAKLVG